PFARISSTTSCAGSASRSFTTTRAPSAASFIATSRPMPRPEPVTMADFPASLLIAWFLSMLDAGATSWPVREWMAVRPGDSVQRHHGFAKQLLFAVLVRALERDLDTFLAAFLVLLGDHARAGWLVAQM